MTKPRFVTGRSSTNAKFPATLKWNTTGEGYQIAPTYTTIDVIRAGDEEYIRFKLKRYSEIFPGYDKDTDIVRTCYDAPDDVVFLELARKAEAVEPPCADEDDDIPAGLYIVDEHGEFDSWRLAPLARPAEDAYIELGNFDRSLAQDMETFFEAEQKYADLALKHRRGCLLHGPPGNGKTLNAIRAVYGAVEKFDAVAIMIPDDVEQFDELVNFREALRGRNVVFIIEELLSKTEHSKTETMSFLDGELSWDHCYTIATTNYPEKLPSNLTDRPGRFDVVVEVPNPDRDARRRYLGHFVAPEIDDGVLLARAFDADPDLRAALADSQDLSIAYLREAVLRTKVRGITLKEAMAELRAMHAQVKKAFAKRSPMGFGGEDDD